MILDVCIHNELAVALTSDFFMFGSKLFSPMDTKIAVKLLIESRLELRSRYFYDIISGRWNDILANVKLNLLMDIVDWNNQNDDALVWSICS